MLFRAQHAHAGLSFCPGVGQTVFHLSLIHICNLLLTWLAGRVDASYLFPLVQGSIIVGVTLCSGLLFREKLSARGRLGILLGGAAIAVINL